MTKLTVKMLGEFQLSTGEAQINDGINRSRKIWLLLAYMIYHRNRLIPPQELMDFLWQDEDHSANPGNALKAMFHRLRNMLDELAPGAGKELILHRGGTYLWNNDIPLTLDIEEFDRLCGEGSALEGEARLQCWREAVDLYNGNFLDKMSAEPWVAPIAARYAALYSETVLTLLPMLEEREKWAEAVALSRKALEQDPYREELYRFLIRGLIRQEEKREAVHVYEHMSELLLSHSGLMPSPETRALYREATHKLNDRTLSPDLVLERLREEAPVRGAMICDSDMFAAICHYTARLIPSEGAVHLALISVESGEKKPLSRRSLERVMANLQNLSRDGLRQGDVLSRCSVSQFLLLLPQASYEESHSLCARLVRTFNRQYPHSPATLRTWVHPLEPNLG